MGVGGIGSRHLQAIVRDGVAKRVHLVDPDPEALSRARALVADDAHSGQVRVEEHGDTAALTADLDVAVVATGSTIRSQVVAALIGTVRVDHLILEKFLFPCRSQYRTVADLVAEAGTTAWVNTPRRLWPGYIQLRDSLDPEAPRSLRVQATPAHGLGSNAVHFLDLFQFLLPGLSRPANELMLHGLDLRLIENRRRTGYVEFDGTVRGSTPRGDHFDITAMPGSRAPLVVSLTCGDEHVVIDEAGRALLRRSVDDVQGWRCEEFSLLLQSELSGRVIRELVTTGQCGLPDLAESTLAHLALLDPFLDALGATEEDAACPVT